MWREVAGMLVDGGGWMTSSPCPAIQQAKCYISEQRWHIKETEGISVALLKTNLHHDFILQSGSHVTAIYMAGSFSFFFHRKGQRLWQLARCL